MDLPTGIVHTLRTRDINAGDSDHLTASPDGSEFTFTRYAGGDLSKVALHIVGRDGLTKASFSVPGSFAGEAKLSFKGDYILVRHGATFHDILGEPTIYTRQGTLVKEYTGYGDYAWLPDGRVVLTKEDSIYLVSSDFGDPVLLKQFVGETPSAPSPSPDGKFIAFMLGRTPQMPTDGSVNMIKIDGTGLRQVAVARYGVEGAGWSPDGDYLVLRSPLVYDAPLLGLTPGCPELLIIPSQSDTAIDVSSESALASPVYQRRDDGSQKKACAWSLPQWRLAQEPLPASKGTSPQDTGVNAGLMGRIWTNGASNYAFYDLTSGLSVNPFSASGIKAFPSFDASEIAYIDNIANRTLTITTLNREIINSFQKSTGAFSGFPQLAPNGQTIAAEWHDIDSGESAAKVVNLFTRDGTTLKRIHNNASEWRWHPDGSLLMVVGTEIYKLPPDFSEPVLLASFLDVPRNLAIDAAGNKLAFQMGGSIWTSNLDGTAMKQMTVSSSIDDNPVWSGDGKWIAFTHKNTKGSPTCDVVHAIPADGERIYIGADWITNNDVEINYFENGELRELCAFSRLGWFD